MQVKSFFKTPFTLYFLLTAWWQTLRLKCGILAKNYIHEFMNNKVCKDVKAIMLLPWQKQCSVPWLCDRFTHNCVTGFSTVLPSTSTRLCEGTIPSRFLNHISPMWLRDAHLWSGSAGFYTNSAFRGRDSRYHWDISEPSGSSRSLGSCKTKIAEILNIIKHLTPYITWRSAGVWFCPAGKRQLFFLLVFNQ